MDVWLISVNTNIVKVTNRARGTYMIRSTYTGHGTGRSSDCVGRLWTYEALKVFRHMCQRTVLNR